MDFNNANGQLAQVQQQSQAVLQNFQVLAQKLTQAAPDPTTGREWAMDLREIALAVQTQNQNVTMLLNQMAEYIRNLEQQLATHPSPSIQPQGWANSIGGGGFLGTVTSGLGLGAGLAVGENVVNDLFSLF